MKVVKFSIILLLSLSTTFLKAQCPVNEIILTQQNEVDNFLTDYPECINAEPNVKIEGDNIQNLTGLLGMHKFFKLIIRDVPNLKNVDGLDSVLVIRTLEIDGVALENLVALSNLDSVRHLNLTFNEIINDLSPFVNLKELNHAWFEGNGYISGIDPVLRDSENHSAILNITNNHFPNDFTGILSPEVTNMLTFNITGSSNFSLKGLSQIDSIFVSFIGDNNNFSFEGIGNVIDIDFLYLHSMDFSNIDPSHSFESLNSIGSLFFFANSEIQSLETIFPSLSTLQRQIILRDNSELQSLESIHWFEPPMDKSYSPVGGLTESRIEIIGNPLLENCESYLLCKALETYPDSMIVTNNGLECEQSYLESADCNPILSTDINTKDQIQIYPNPFSEQIDIQTEEKKIKAIELYDYTGKLILKKKNNINPIKTADLMSGIYILRIQVEESVVLKQVIKN